jgi:hypothetical protein
MIRTIAGWSLIVIGAIACPLPLVPGIPIVLLGAALLGQDHPAVRKCKAWFTKQ